MLRHPKNQSTKSTKFHVSNKLDTFCVGLFTSDVKFRPRLYGEKLSRVEGSPALPSQLLTTVYMGKVVPVDRVKVNPTKLFIDPA